MVTVQDAEKSATDVARPYWSNGTFMVAQVYEDVDYYAVVYGAEEWYLRGDDDYLLIGDWPVFVRRMDGAVVLPAGVEGVDDVVDYLDKMALIVDRTTPQPQ
jgi:hypothetical protein